MPPLHLQQLHYCQPKSLYSRGLLCIPPQSSAKPFSTATTPRSFPARPSHSPHPSSASAPRRSINDHRPFSTTTPTHLRTTELTPTHFSTSLRANSTRLWSSIHDTSKWGTGHRYGDLPEETGMSRLTLTDADKHARDWFAQTCTALGCQVSVDAMGNQFAVRPGRSGGGGDTGSIAPTFAGSHLDTQPRGGRFDGVLGVCAGIEMLTLLQDNWIETEGPVGVVNWTNEEGARFSRSMMGSGVWSGKLAQDSIYALKEAGVEPAQAKTVEQELRRIGYLGSIPCSATDGVRLGAHFELHIEQGPHLVRAGEHVGAVEGVQAYRWYTVHVHGRDCHTGTTAFAHRADALHWAALVISSLRGVAEKHGGLASVGIVRVEPGSVNTVPGHVMFSLDIRHAEDGGVGRIEDEVRTLLARVQRESKTDGAPGVTAEVEEDFRSEAIRFDAEAVACVAEAGRDVVGLAEGEGEVRRMTSGAGHDSVFTNVHCPTAMIFVPCRDGVSHHPEEWCEMEDCAVGASVLTEAVLRFDRLRHERGDFT